MPDWSQIDYQLRRWETRLRDDVGLSPSQANALASHISAEIAALAPSVQDRLQRLSNIPLTSRLEEIKAFQLWMDVVAVNQPHPALIRAQVITQNYICLVYLKESWFEALHQVMTPDTATFLNCTFLLSEPLRRFRNAFAHGNWRYLEDFSGLEFWAHAKGYGKKEVRSVVLQLEMNFWQTLSRCTAYASMVTLDEGSA